MIRDLFADIAPAVAMGIRGTRFDKGRIELIAPFVQNSNDKGTAFAGSISSMLSLAGWGTITLSLREAGVDADVMIVKSEIEYSAAARSALFAEAELSQAEADRIVRNLQERGRSRVRIESTLCSEGRPCASCIAHYAVIAKPA